MTNDDSQFEVGCGKPPKSGQFAKGKSGNPKGRPKGSKNLATILLREASQPVLVNGPKGTRKVTKLQAAAMQLSTKAAQGDHRASRELFSLVERSEFAVNAGSASKSLTETDQTVMEMILRRVREVKPVSADSDQGETST
jgi:Family of unknown function (DUF5681)